MLSLSLLLSISLVFAVEPTGSGQDLPAAKAAVVICKGMVDDGLFKSIKRRSQIALEQGADYLIFEIDTYGGGLFAAYDISEYLLHELNAKAHTVAYIPTKAISAGALISVACKDIVMKENTRIGDCAPIMLGGKLEGVEREKIETDTRTAFAVSAEENGYPDVLLKAMVTQQIEVYRIKNLKTNQCEFFEGDRLPSDANSYDLENKELIVSSDELLTLKASEALEYGLARALVKDRQGVLDFLAQRDGVRFVGEPMVLKTTWSEELVRWLNSPAVMAVLVMLAMLGVYLELSSPGVGLPGLVALISIVIIIGSKYMVDLANWVEVLVLLLGVALLLVEIFVLPGFGVAGIAGILCILAGIFGMLVKNPPDQVPWPRSPLDWRLFFNGVVGLALGFVGFIVAARLLAKYLPKTRFMSGLVLVPGAAKPGRARVSMTHPPESQTVSLQVGQLGEAVSTLRPSGKARFGEAIVDVVAEAEFLDRGTRVEIIEIRGNRVVVRAAQDRQ